MRVGALALDGTVRFEAMTGWELELCAGSLGYGDGQMATASPWAHPGTL